MRPVDCAKYISSLFVFLILPASRSLKQWKAFPSHPAGQTEWAAEWEPGLWWSTASWGSPYLSYQLFSNYMEYHWSDRIRKDSNFISIHVTSRQDKYPLKDSTFDAMGTLLCLNMKVRRWGLKKYVWMQSDQKARIRHFSRENKNNLGFRLTLFVTGCL